MIQALEEPTHYQHKIKCLKCSLHFVVCSWEAEWGEKNKVNCPECQNSGSNMLLFNPQLVKQAIYEVVPGFGPSNAAKIKK